MATPDTTETLEQIANRIAREHIGVASYHDKPQPEACGWHMFLILDDWILIAILIGQSLKSSVPDLLEKATRVDKVEISLAMR